MRRISSTVGVGLGHAHARGGLVQAQELGLGGRARCRSRGCAARRARGWRPARPALSREPHRRPARRAPARCTSVKARWWRSRLQRVPARLGGDAHVLEHGGAGQDVGDLVRAGQRLARDPVGRQPGDVLAVEAGCGPPVGRSTPVRQLKNVDLPAPLGPMMARISPRGTATFTLLSAVRPPKRTLRPSVRRMGRGAPAVGGRGRRWR